MTDVIAVQAAALWNIPAQNIVLAAKRENVVFKARKNGTDYALRVHRKDYRTQSELLSELQWMEELARNGLTVPQPILSGNGSLVEYVDGAPTSVLTWIAGTPSGATGQLNVSDPLRFAERLGRAMARLHQISDAWTVPSCFSRPSWDLEGLLGETPLWGPFWDNPDLTPEDAQLLRDTRSRAYAYLKEQARDLDFGLIHADIITENVLVDGAHINLIDFDDGGWGFRVFELATFLMRFLDHPAYPEVREALLQGYASRTVIAPETLDFFILLRALTYPGWVIPRRSEPGGAKRSQIAIRTAIPLARAFMAL